MILPFLFLFLSGTAMVGVAPLGGTRAFPGPTVEPRIAADFSGVKASISLSLCEDPVIQVLGILHLLNFQVSMLLYLVFVNI